MNKHWRIVFVFLSILWLLVSFFENGFAAPGPCDDTACLDGDFNKDFYVNFDDFASLGSAWTSRPSDAIWNPDCDISEPKDNVINFSDIKVFVENWLKCTDPYNYDCDAYWDRYQPIVLQNTERTISVGHPIVLFPELPSYMNKAYLEAEGRVVWPGQSWRGGSNTCIRYLVNGHLVGGPEKMVNVPDARDLITPLGSSMTWYCVGDRWSLPYSPDFAPFVGVTNPVELGDTPYRIVLDISDYITSGENQIEIRHSEWNYPDVTMVYRNIRILGKSERPAPDPNLREVPADLSGKPVVPDTNFNVNYSANLSSGGGIVVNIGGDQYKVESKFSYPNGTYNILTVPGPTTGEWTVNVNGNQLTAQGSKYRVERQIISHPEYIEVEDKITNLTGSTIGVCLGNEIKKARSLLKKVYLAGLRLSATEWVTGGISESGNPTVYVQNQSSGLGLLAYDKVLRSQINLKVTDGAYGLYDYFFALGANASYTIQWRIFPTDCADYYAFINAARRTLGVNYLIDGCIVMPNTNYVGNMASVTDEDIINLVQRQNAKYIVLDTSYRVDQNGNPLTTGTINDTSFGSAFMTDYGYWNRYWLLRTIERFRQLVPDVILLPYNNFWLTSEPNAVTIYPDSYAQQSNGNPQVYYGYGLKGMYPTQANSYGQALKNFFDFSLQQGDGLYVDESSMTKNPDSDVYSYRNDTWDGHSAIINRSSFQIQRTVTHSGLYTLDYRLSQINKARWMGKGLWMNFAPITPEETQLHAYHFIETHINNNAAYAHLTSDTALGNDFWELTEHDLGAGVRIKLLYGGLYLPYSRVYQTDDNIVQVLYPFKPIELHNGYVIGENKIVTRIAGEYGFGDNSDLTVRIYDAGGFYLPGCSSTVRYDANVGSTLANVALDVNAGEMAVIFRQPPAYASFPRPENGEVNVSTTSLLKWCPGEDASFHDIYLGTNYNDVNTAIYTSPLYKGRKTGIPASVVYDPQPLQPNTTYYWRVDEINDSNYITHGRVWSFITAPARWFINFENGFTASSGTVSVLGGNVNQPTVGLDVYTLYDTAADGNVVRVGRPGGGDCHLNYSNLDENILGSNGIITIDFKLNGELNDHAVLFSACPNALYGVGFWFLDIIEKDIIRVCSYTSGATPPSDAGYKNYDIHLATPLSDGWHTMKFSWKRIVAADYNSPMVREKADIKLWIDESLELNEANVFWTEPNFGSLNVGLMWLGSTSSRDFQAGEQNILLDNLTIAP